MKNNNCDIYSQLTGISLVIGGARSGKSRFGERIALALNPNPLYIATAEMRDEEMRCRIDRHRQDRGDVWSTLEEPLAVASAITAHGEKTILLECLTLWLSNLMEQDMDVEKEAGHLRRVLEAHPGNIILIANEVGQGIVPDNALAREFRDHAGRLNQSIAEIADNVIYMVAGLPMIAKKNGAATFGEYS